MAQVLLLLSDIAATEEYNGSSWTSTSPSNWLLLHEMVYGRSWYQPSAGVIFGGRLAGGSEASTKCNRRIHTFWNSSNKNNYSKLTGGKYGNKNIHRS
jgi:hypothetical protein